MAKKTTPGSTPPLQRPETEVERVRRALAERMAKKEAQDSTSKPSAAQEPPKETETEEQATRQQAAEKGAKKAKSEEQPAGRPSQKGEPENPTLEKKPATPGVGKATKKKPATGKAKSAPGAAVRERYERFAHEYFKDLNATQAAIRAGYSEKTAKAQGCRLLTNVDVQALLKEKRAQLQEKHKVDEDRVIRELALLGFANMADYMRPGADGAPYLDFSGLTQEQTAALTEVITETFMDGRGEDAREVRRVKFKLADKRAALVDLGKHLGIFTDKVKHDMTDSMAELLGLVRNKSMGPPSERSR